MLLLWQDGCGIFAVWVSVRPRSISLPPMALRRAYPSTMANRNGARVSPRRTLAVILNSLEMLSSVTTLAHVLEYIALMAFKSISGIPLVLSILNIVAWFIGLNAFLKSRKVSTAGRSFLLAFSIIQHRARCDLWWTSSARTHSGCTRVGDQWTCWGCSWG